MKIIIPVVVLGVLFLAGCSDSQNPSSPANTNAAVSSGNPLNAPADYVGALAKGKAAAIKTVDVASLTQAIQMFNVQEGRYPKDLNELVESKLINKIPDAPYGMKLVYDAVAGKVTVVKAD